MDEQDNAESFSGRGFLRIFSYLHGHVKLGRAFFSSIGPSRVLRELTIAGLVLIMPRISYRFLRQA